VWISSPHQGAQFLREFLAYLVDLPRELTQAARTRRFLIAATRH